jgi:hypothetical protein
MSAAALDLPQATPVIQLAGADVPGIVVYASVRGPDGALAGTAAGTFRISSLITEVSGLLPADAAFELRQDGRRIGGHGALGAHPMSWTVDVSGQD